MIRAVLDTNVWISGFLTPEGVPGQILHYWRKGRFEVVISQEMLEEMGEVLTRPRILDRLGWTVEEVTGLLLSMYGHGIVAPGTLRVRVVKEDPTDDKFFSAAIEGEADCVVSGDTQIQKVKRYRGISVLSPARFLERVQ